MKFYYRLVIVVILSFLFVACARASSSPTAGLRSIEVAAIPGRKTPINVSLWYPTSEGGSHKVVGGNKVFKGVPVNQDAVIVEGEFPLVLLSHGGLRAAPNLSGWIASYLATQGFIVADPSGRAVTPQTPFILGSTTKSFTALAVMQLVEAGKVELDAPVQRYIPWFRVAAEAASAQITVRHLLNQSSGFST